MKSDRGPNASYAVLDRTIRIAGRIYDAEKSRTISVNFGRRNIEPDRGTSEIMTFSYSGAFVYFFLGLFRAALWPRLQTLLNPRFHSLFFSDIDSHQLPFIELNIRCAFVRVR